MTNLPNDWKSRRPVRQPFNPETNDPLLTKPMKKTKLFDLVLYPILIGVYAVMVLTAANINQLFIRDALRPTLFAISFSLAVFFCFWLVLKKDIHRAGLWTGLFLLMFFTYGHLYQLVEGRGIFGFVIGRHRYLFPIWLLLFVVGSWWVLKKISKPVRWTRPLNVLLLLMMVAPVGQIGWYQIRGYNLRPEQSVNSQVPAQTGTGSERPDVYYIILDGYSRQDIIQKLYNYDITPFIEGLEDLGFMLPDCAQSNYAHTALSLASSLNMDYMINIESKPHEGDHFLDSQLYGGYIKSSAVMKQFRELGYQVVTFSTIYLFTDVTNADVYIASNNNPLAINDPRVTLTDFEVLFLRTTALRVLTESTEAFIAPLQKQLKSPEEATYDRLNFQFDSLENIPELPGNKFVFAHIAAPHAPFVFAPDGSFQVSPNQATGYAPEIQYINQRMMEILKKIIATSKVPPVIIIQGDHGWNLDYRMQILNAYYLPGAKDLVYPTLTPVNSFRIVFNHYFDLQYPLVQDVSYYSTEDLPLKMQEEPFTCVSKVK